MDTEEVTNPDTVASPEPEAPAEEVTQEATQETEDQTPAQADTVDEDLEDLEIDGKPIKVHKSVKPLVMMHADYTQKTQALADERRKFIAQQEAHRAEMAGVGKLMNIDERLNQHAQYFNTPDWMQLKAEDPQRAQSIWMDYQQLRDTRANLASELETKHRQRAADTERERANQISQAHAELAKPDPAMGWTGKFDAETKSKLNEFAYRTGYTDQQLANASPRDVKVLNLAMLGEQFLKQQKALAKPQTAGAIQPVPKVDRSRGTGTNNPADMDMERYAAWRKAGGGGGRR